MKAFDSPLSLSKMDYQGLFCLPFSLWVAAKRFAFRRLRVPEGRERAMSGANGLCVGKRRRLTLRVSPHPPFGHLPPEGDGWVLL